MTSPPAFTVHRAHHTGFTVRSLSSSLAFWHDLLGAPVVARRTLSLGPLPNVIGIEGAEMKMAQLALPGGDGHVIELLEYTSPADREVYRPRACDVGSVHVALEVVGAAALMEAAGSLGWEGLSDAPVEMRRADGSLWGLAYLRGPDGEVVELMERLEG